MRGALVGAIMSCLPALVLTKFNSPNHCADATVATKDKGYE
jgi:hypothetical protein